MSLTRVALSELGMSNVYDSVKKLKPVFITQIDQVEYVVDLLVFESWALMTSTSFINGKKSSLSLLQSDLLTVCLLFMLIHLNYFTTFVTVHLLFRTCFILKSYSILAWNSVLFSIFILFSFKKVVIFLPGFIYVSL